MTIEQLSKNERTILSRHEIADVHFDHLTRHHSLHAARRFAAGEIIIAFSAGSVQHYPTYLTVQTGEDKHITLAPSFLQYINHSCDPNVFFDTATMHLLCLRAIEPGEEFCFFYPSTEWEMAQPFVCNCGSARCLQLIGGAKDLTADTLAKYRLTDFILEKIKGKN